MTVLTKWAGLSAALWTQTQTHTPRKIDSDWISFQIRICKMRLATVKSCGCDLKTGVIIIGLLNLVSFNLKAQSDQLSFSQLIWFICYSDDSSGCWTWSVLFLVICQSGVAVYDLVPNFSFGECPNRNIVSKIETFLKYRFLPNIIFSQNKNFSKKKDLSFSPDWSIALLHRFCNGRHWWRCF